MYDTFYISAVFSIGEVAPEKWAILRAS